MTDKITIRDERLLKREGYIRRERHACVGLSILCLLGSIAVPLIDREQTVPETAISSGFIAIICLLGYAYFCTLRIRHIESIKHLRLRMEKHDAA